MIFIQLINQDDLSIYLFVWNQLFEYLTIIHSGEYKYTISITIQAIFFHNILKYLLWCTCNTHSQIKILWWKAVDHNIYISNFILFFVVSHGGCINSMKLLKCCLHCQYVTIYSSKTLNFNTVAPLFYSFTWWDMPKSWLTPVHISQRWMLKY